MLELSTERSKIYKNHNFQGTGGGGVLLDAPEKLDRKYLAMDLTTGGPFLICINLELYNHTDLCDQGMGLSIQWISRLFRMH